MKRSSSSSKPLTPSEASGRKLIVFYEGECPLCNRAVHFLIQRDKDHRFIYEPLEEPSDTLIFFDNGKIYRYGKGALRIAWHLGGVWSLLGLCSFLPKWMVDPPYRWVAKHRHLL